MLKQIIAPSVLNANFLELGNGLKAIENGGAGLVHLDIMDGHFVPNISFGPGISACVGKGTKLPLDCHLMIENPEKYVGEFAKAGAAIISVHAETTNHLDRLLHQIRELGVKPAVAINPATPLESIKYVLDIVDMVLIMSVNPGFGGQSLIPYCLDKIRELRAMKPELDIQIDGGVKLDNILAARKRVRTCSWWAPRFSANPTPRRCAASSWRRSAARLPIQIIFPFENRNGPHERAVILVFAMTPFGLFAIHRPCQIFLEIPVDLHSVEIHVVVLEDKHGRRVIDPATDIEFR